MERIISDEDNKSLCKEVSFEEAKVATFNLPPDKPPRPDGFPPFFFQKYWTLVGRSLFRAVREFFHSRSLLKEVNYTFITLIHMTDDPSNLDHFRRISLCSTS